HKDNFGVMNGKDVQHGKWADEVLINYAIEFIRKNRDQPFFAYLPSMTCHGPLEAPEVYIRKYLNKGLSQNLATLYAMVDHFDFQLQRLIETVDELGLAENTVILFMSDNGPAVNNGAFTDEDRQIRYVSGLKGHKGNIWENGVKSPLFIRWKGHYEPTIVNDLADVTDILPTLLDIAGIELSSGNLPLDGRSIKPVLEGNIPEQWPEKLSYNYANPGWPPTYLPWTPEGVKDEYRPVEPGTKKDLNTEDQIIYVRSQQYKLLLNPDVEHNGGTLEEGYAMYDIINDPLEKDNIVNTNPETAEKLKMELDQWFEGIKQAPHSFMAPLFVIGKNGRTDNIIKGQGPVRISSNLKNTVGSLNGWKEAGDFAEYTIEVVTPGDYSVIINHGSAHASGAGIMVSVGEERISATLMDKQKSEPGVISLKQGKTLLRFEITDVPGGSPGIVMDKLRSIQLLKQ
ncbi:MAG: sulfatase-like hydrolase/transferase, partial [Bacteroidales bacterium]|nr:sulfatase-like hydrolase/transferase [Bacteroidales bacterium]